MADKRHYIYRKSVGGNALQPAGDVFSAEAVHPETDGGYSLGYKIFEITVFSKRITVGMQVNKSRGQRQACSINYSSRLRAVVCADECNPVLADKYICLKWFITRSVKYPGIFY